MLTKNKQKLKLLVLLSHLCRWLYGYIDDVKKRIGLKDDKQDEQLQEIIKSCESQLLSMLLLRLNKYRKGLAI
ncbi:phi 11 orf36 [Staphylococcus aureus]|uniref:Phi 11 orf36 n=1 Tax=Staphylococcus aureus TaxID=1280 RepID=A0A380E2K1_STAAU|nr:phi 11 orf36 [Staphylococcus aureus]